MIDDLHRNPIAHMNSAFDPLHFYMPLAAINEVVDQLGIPPIDELCLPEGAWIQDPVVAHLMSALRAALKLPEEACSLFTDHVAMALRAHIARNYGGKRPRQIDRRGGLAPWQLRRVEELAESQLDGELPLERLARECGLSASHFARAFRESTGLSPHRWLLTRRVERAKALLRGNALSLSEIALKSGFADQSHFTRTFTKLVGTSPGRFRRQLRSSS